MIGMCHVFIRIPHSSLKPRRVVMIAGASSGQGPLILRDSQVSLQDRLQSWPQPFSGLCNNQDIPYARAVKMLFCWVQSGISSSDNWEKRVENISLRSTFLDVFISNPFKVKDAQVSLHFEEKQKSVIESGESWHLEITPFQQFWHIRATSPFSSEKQPYTVDCGSGFSPLGTFTQNTTVCKMKSQLWGFCNITFVMYITLWYNPPVNPQHSICIALPNCNHMTQVQYDCRWQAATVMTFWYRWYMPPSFSHIGPSSS